MTAPTLTDLQRLLAELQARVDAGTASLGDIEAAAEAALCAADALASWRAVEAQAKRLIGAMMDAGSIDQFVTTRGGATIQRGKPAQVITYQAHALDVACHVRPDIAAAITPYRRQHTRAGGLRIVRGAGSGANGAANGQANGAAKAKVTP